MLGEGRGWAGVVAFARDCVFGVGEKAQQGQICLKTSVPDCAYKTLQNHVIIAKA